METIYGNKDFGICFTYFYTNTDNQYLIDDDFVQFDINYETQQKFLINGYYDGKYSLNDELKLYSSDYFRFYIFTKPLNPSHMVSSDEWIHTKRIGLNARLKITTSNFHLLSNPYMKRCHENGIYFNYFSFLKFFENSYEIYYCRYSALSIGRTYGYIFLNQNYI